MQDALHYTTYAAKVNGPTLVFYALFTNTPGKTTAEGKATLG